MVTNDTFSKDCQEHFKIRCQQHPGYGVHSKAFGLGICCNICLRMMLVRF